MEYFDLYVALNVLCPISNAAVNFPINQGATILCVLRALLHVAVQRNITDAHSAHKDTQERERDERAMMLRRSGRRRAASFFPTNFVESLVHCRSVFHREILASFLSILFSFFFFVLSSFCVHPLLSLLFDAFFRSAFPIVASLRVTRTAAFNKIELSFCG